MKESLINQLLRVPWQLAVAVGLLVFALLFRFCLNGYKTTAYCLVALAAVFAVLFLLRQHAVLRTVFCVVAGLAAVALAVAEIPVVAASRGEDTDAPYLVVLGAGINGLTPSLSLQNRLTTAQEYLMAHPDTVAIVSGGQGADEIVPESRVMADWLIAGGIDRERVIEENRSSSTQENLTFSFDLIRARGGDPADGVAIVTSEYHLYRAKKMAAALGATPYGVAAHTTYLTLRWNYYLREAFAVWAMWVFG